MITGVHMESCIDPRIRVLLSMIQRRKGDVRLRSRDAAKLLGLGEVQLLRLLVIAAAEPAKVRQLLISRPELAQTFSV